MQINWHDKLLRISRISRFRHSWEYSKVILIVILIVKDRWRSAEFILRMEKNDEDLGCLQPCSAGMSVRPDRYYLIFHVKAFRIPERHLIHVSPFEAHRIRVSIARREGITRRREESYFEKSSPIVKCHNFFRHPTRVPISIRRSNYFLQPGAHWMREYRRGTSRCIKCQIHLKYRPCDKT